MNQPEDVKVILAPDRHYQFHANVLARNSTLLASMLTERSAVRLSSRARNAGIKIRWTIALTKGPDDEHPAGKLELVDLNAMGEPYQHPSGLLLNENGRIPLAPALITNYESIFYAFYNRDLPIDDSDMATALQHTLEILKIATYLGCVSIISKPIDVAFVKHGQAFFRSIQKMPWSWISLALNIRSEMIFRESVVHLAGNWRKIEQDGVAMGRIGELECAEAVRMLCKRLHRGLVAKGRKLELALASLYPGGMATPSSQIPIKREEYAKDVLVWMALSFFRHWLSQKLISEKGSSGADGGFELYAQLGKAGEAYMDKNIIEQFHSKFPMTKKALNVLENHLLEIKECVKGVVDSHGVLVSKCMLDTRKFPVDYMTCVEVRKEDLPWFEKDKGNDGIGRALGPGKKRGMRPGGNALVQKAHAAVRDQERASEENDDEENGYEGEDEELTTPSKRGRYA